MSTLMIYKKTGGHMYQLAFREFSFATTFSEKEQTKNITTTNCIALAVRWSVKKFYAPNFPKSSRE